MKYIATLQLTIPHVIAGSWSAGTAAYFVAQQYDDMVWIWKDKLSTKDFINPYRISKVLDIDYLIDVVFKEQIPLDVDALLSSSIIFEIPVTNADSAVVDFKSPDVEDIFELMRATKAVPWAYGRSVELVDGHRYIDGSNSSWYELWLDRMMGLWYDAIIVVNNGVLMSDTAMKLYTWMKNREFAKQYQSDFARRAVMRNIDHPPHVIMIQPDKALDFGWKWILHNNSQTLSDAIDHGYRVAERILSSVLD